MSIAQDLIAKAERREILFGIVGLGYVGLPLAVELAQAGYRVLGFDVNPSVVEGLNAGPVARQGCHRRAAAGGMQCGRFSATTDMSRLWRSRTRSRSACPRRSRSSRIPTSATSWPPPRR